VQDHQSKESMQQPQSKESMTIEDIDVLGPSLITRLPRLPFHLKTKPQMTKFNFLKT
jgi:hypothetical protein